ncbi:uncharacterized protein HNO88_003235 [Novosphingobium chloroacetimidivorans]|uniref:DUF418 domain-containing protein n=1 Tax=Novosphingobium chloroacetimidivorans TaxID=1428314 RepID=A0A7W7KBQ9_9SPHN|nr:DUF418 domain-containing protein [Novosphingobium chloroacetimidivorans]MBB4859902.1 uncharacterized protein [Novosphingobium chloroacetimidivorans]
MRVASLDLIRGVAVLGILAINIAGFAGPSIGTLSPNLPTPGGIGNEAAYAFGFVLFEGKMRALFAILFGAGLALFINRVEAQGRDGDLLQARRLGWLLLFGALHYYLLWWGDILFAYAACGLIVLLLHRLPPRMLGAGAAALFVVMHLPGLLANLPMVDAEEAVRLGTANPEQTAAVARYGDYLTAAFQREMEQYTGGYLHILATRMQDHPLWPLGSVRDGFGEYVPLMTFGLLLQRSGFFAGAWPLRTMALLGSGATLAGLSATLLSLGWLWERHFPLIAMDTSLRYGLALPHLVTAIGYLTLLVLATPWLGRTRIGQRLAAAGRMAFSNYLGTSLVMTGIFYGWGLGLFGQVDALSQWLFVLFGWALMLGWSAPWLRHWRRGPLEWLWRCLTEGKLLSNRA